MRSHEPTVQRSFRLSSRTLELLDERADARGVSRNALAEQLLGEAVRTDRHPLIRFREGRSHAGLVFTSDASLPRTRATIGTYVGLLADLLSDNLDAGAFTGRIHWL